MRLLRRGLAACSALAFVGQTPAPSAADALFARAVAVVEHDSRAPYATYTVVVAVTSGGRRTVASWKTTEDLRRSIVLADSFSQQERANPATPHGANVVAHRRIWFSAQRNLNPGFDPASSFSLKSPPVNPERSGDLVGPVALAVDQNYGLTRPRAYRIARDEKTVVESASELTLIGRTGASEARYRVTLLDISDGIAHLGLTPLRDAYHNRLREAWIEPQSAEIREAIVQGVGDRPPFDGVRWHVTFARRDGATFVTEVHSLEPLHVGSNVADVAIAFTDLALLAQSPLSASFGIEAPVRYLRDP